MALVLAVLALAIALAGLYLVADGSKKAEAVVKRHAETEFGKQTRAIERVGALVDTIDARLQALEKASQGAEARYGQLAGQLASLSADLDDFKSRRVRATTQPLDDKIRPTEDAQAPPEGAGDESEDSDGN